MLGSCAVISGNPRDATPPRPAILTVSTVPATAPLDDDALDRMAAFFSTEAGRSALGRSEAAGPVALLDLTRYDGLLLAHVEDGADTGDVADHYWRAVFEASGKLVTVTVSGFRTAPLDAAAGTRLTRDFVAAIRRANGDRPSGTAAGGLMSVFNRLLYRNLLF